MFATVIYSKTPFKSQIVKLYSFDLLESINKTKIKLNWKLEKFLILDGVAFNTFDGRHAFARIVNVTKSTIILNSSINLLCILENPEDRLLCVEFNHAFNMKNYATRRTTIP